MNPTDKVHSQGPPGSAQQPPDATEAGRLLATKPPHRRLRVFSLDPAVDSKLEHSLISRSVLKVAWEEKLQPGPVGEYLEVIDVDPSSGCVYDPVDLTRGDILAQDGLSPSTGNPQFHQQMVYAVGMKTIANFEDVLGRKLLWAERRKDDDGKGIDGPENRYVQQLRIYPHAVGCAKLRSGCEGVLVKQSAESIAAVDVTDGCRCGRDRSPSSDGRDEA